MKKRVLAWLLALTMMLTLLPLSVFAGEADTDSAYGRGILTRMDNAEALLYVYDTLAAASAGTPSRINVSHDKYKVTWDELCIVYNLVLSDHPEYFWHSSYSRGSVSANGYALSLEPTYIMTGAELEQAKAELEAEVVRLTAGLEDKSDYEKSLIIHDRVAEDCSYVFNDYDQTAYGALVRGEAVCAGYARAYQLLMKRVGIPTWYVTGDSYSPAGELVPHAWNLVLLDGEWYYTDVTWDDQESYTYYAYLNVTTAQITEDHIFGSYVEYLPNATATDANFFVRNNLQAETFDMDMVVRALRDYSPSRIYITGDKKAFLDEIAHNLWDVMDALNAPPGSVSYRYSSLSHEVILRITVNHECAYETHRVEPTCKDEGYSVEICRYEICDNERNYVVLPATGEHLYENACATTCLTCGLVRETEGHVYQYPCSTRCQECGALRQEEAVHERAETVITPATCGKEGMSRFTCIYCGDSFTMITPMTLQHVYDNDCDEECNACGTWRTVAGHSYDNDCDDTCNSCGYVRGIGGHVYDGSCDADCNLCGAVREGAAHAYDNDCDADCNDCGFTRTAPHAYDDDQDADCNVCGTVREVASEELLIYGVTDNTILTRGDTVTLSVMMTNNPGLVGWMIEVAFDESVLELVDQSAGDAFPASGLAFGPLKSPANATFIDFVHPDVTADGVLYTLTFRVKEDAPFGDVMLEIYCSDMENFSNAKWEYIDATFEGAFVVVDDHTHTYASACDDECDYCHFTRVAEEHIYDNACDVDCNDCGAIREVEPHVYDSVVTDPTCTAEGYTTHTCTICGHSYVDSTVAMLEHTYDNACDTDCNVCGYVREVGDHVYDHDYDAICNECGYEREIPCIPGDVNDDGKVNVRDQGLLQQYLNGWEVTINLAAADVNGDGKVNVRDQGLLQQYLNGWDVNLQ